MDDHHFHPPFSCSPAEDPVDLETMLACMRASKRLTRFIRTQAKKAIKDDDVAAQQCLRQYCVPAADEREAFGLVLVADPDDPTGERQVVRCTEHAGLLAAVANNL